MLEAERLTKKPMNSHHAKTEFRRDLSSSMVVRAYFRLTEVKGRVVRKILV